MKKKLTVFLMVLCFISITNGAIYVEGQLYSGNVLNITETSNNNASVQVTESSIVNIFYADYFNPIFHDYQPAVGFNISAYGNSVTNFIFPEGYNFEIDSLTFPYNSLAVYKGLQINNLNYPSVVSDFTILRLYDPGVPQVLDPYFGGGQLHDNAVMNFVPEPATILLLLMGVGGIRKLSSR